MENIKERKNFTIRLDIDLHERIKIQAIKEKRTVSDIINDVVKQYLDNVKES